MAAARDEITAKTILDQLECDNVIKRSQPRQKGGKFGQYVFTLINNEAKLQRDYFCPILNIAHHVSYASPTRRESVLSDWKVGPCGNLCAQHIVSPEPSPKHSTTHTLGDEPAELISLYLET